MLRPVVLVVVVLGPGFLQQLGIALFWLPATVVLAAVLSVAVQLVAVQFVEVLLAAALRKRALFSGTVFLSRLVL